MDAGPIVSTAPHAIDRTVFSQRWSDLTFLHWAVAPGRVAPYLPAGVRPDTIDGRSYVGLVPFLMRAGAAVLFGPRKTVGTGTGLADTR